MERWLAILLLLLPVTQTAAAVVWIEGEHAGPAAVTRHPWYGRVDTKQLSGDEFLSHWDDKPGEVTYTFLAPKAGQYDLWLRANPTGTKLSFKMNDGEWTAISFASAEGGANIAADGKVDLRFIAWAPAGKVPLKKNDNTIAFRFHSDNKNHGMIDCFVLADQPFKPRGILKPEQMAAAAAEDAKANAGWFPFDPPADEYQDAISLRYLNEKVAGLGGFISARGDQFIHSKTGKPIRFWGVNKAGKATDHQSADAAARFLAKRGVNLVRLHGAIYDREGKLDPKKVQEIRDIVFAMKDQGIYTHLSIYFPLWMTPSPDNPVLKGYDGRTHPFAALYFNPAFQSQYRAWWVALLTTAPPGQKKLNDEPAVMGCEIINEDSFFFWTFNDKIPEPQLQMIEKEFCDWAVAKFGSTSKAITAWNGLAVRRDKPAEGRLAFRNWWNVKNERTPRDIDQVRFLAEKQKRFYEEQYKYLRTIGFKGVITASNWITASPELLGPIERYTNTPGDFIDRHGYFSSGLKGDNAGWSIRAGHTFVDRSVLRFEGTEPGRQQFTHPAFDITYADKPTMISETTHERPNRYRGEAALLYAAYGALQDTDAIVHFAFDSDRWEVKPNFFMQQWTLTSPAMMGQFPAAALIYRKSLISPGDVVAELNLNVDDLLNLKGTPLAEGMSLDELRLKDIPAGANLDADTPIDPLVHLAGRTRVNFNEGPAKLTDISKLIDRKAGVVTSGNGQLRWDYKAGVLTLAASQAQGASGNLSKAIDLPAVAIRGTELSHIVLVSLDDKPIANSDRILLQVMTEEKPTGFTTDRETGTRRIGEIGRDPWLVRDIAGTVSLKRADAAKLKLTPLDHNGYRKASRAVGEMIALDRDVVYYLIER